MITIELSNTEAILKGLDDKKILKEIDFLLSYQVQGFQFMSVRNNWDGRYRLFKRSGKFPIGMLPTVEEVLSKNQLEYQVIDRRGVVAGQELPLRDGTFYVPRYYQVNACEAAIKAGSGIIQAATGCHAKGTKVIMYDGSFKKVEDVKVGDLLMGPDSKPRTVLSLARGQDDMVKIKPTKGRSFIINKEHILSLQRTKKFSKDKSFGKIIDIKFSDWENQSKTYKHIHKLFRVPISFEEKDLKIDPYFVGLMLGDGSLKRTPAITSTDEEIIKIAQYQAQKYNLNFTKRKITYYLSSKEKTKGSNELINILKEEGLWNLSSGDKYIPLKYKTGSRKQRFEILAGLLDSNGSLTNNGFDYISKSKQLSNDLAYICRSLGLAAYVKKVKKTCTNNNISNFYYRVSISGDCHLIPNKIKRKIAGERRQIKSVLRTGFSYEYLGKGDYYGFQIDGDHRYLLEDFTVTHNSGKTLMISMIMAKYNCKTVVYVIGTDLLYQMKDTIEEAYGIECGIVGDGHCDIKQVTVATVWSAAAAFNKKAKYNDSDLHMDSARKNKLLNKAAVRDMVQEAELFFVDECQYAAAQTIQFLHKASKSARHRFLLSGTPWRDTGDDVLIEAVGGPKFFQITASELIREGYLVPPMIHFVEVPNKRGIGKTYQEIYNNYIVENEERNQKIVDAAKKLVAAGRRVLILIVRKNHGKILEEMLETDLTVASLDGSNKTEDRLEAIRSMRTGEVDVLIASKIFDQGVDIPELDALILAGSGKSTGRALQRIGRVIRTGPKDKKDAIVVDFYDNCKYLRDHSRSRHKIYSTEPEFRIKLPKGRRKL